ncbi:hypothetical protein GCM10023351_06520 [Microbacterium gilvum]|uniref:Secreted protein n=2 Tax=Microbacterium gilvum TaxID=1336204 RepID=A0ABP8ZTW5_9MICO
MGAALLGAIGCASAIPSTEESPAPPAAAESAHCGNLVFPATALENRTRVDRLDERDAAVAATAVDDLGEPLALDAAAGWFLVVSDDDTLAFLRPADPAFEAPYELVALHRDLSGRGGADAVWRLSGRGACTPRADIGDRNDADVSLDPARPPSSDATTVHLLVTENACHGGEDAEGRVEVVELVETAETIALTIGVRPDTSHDAWTCPGHPATPFAVELSAPIGDRTLVDAGLVPARPLHD